jgi:O-antigen ligase
MFKGVLLGTLPFYPFYFFAQRGILTEKRILHCFIFILPIAILQFFYNADNILSHNILYQQNSEDKNIVNNIAYNFVALIPFVFFIRKKILSIACIGLLMFFIIQGAKRGALITGVIAMVFFVYYQMRTINKRNRVKSYLIIFVGISVLLYYVFNFYQNNQYLISRMQQIQETGGSGRNLIYADIFNGWLESDTYIHLLFGYGFAASWKFAGNFAHNDWLELLSNFGLIGVAIYCFLFYSVIKNIYDRQKDFQNRIILKTIFFTWLAVSLFSMGYTNVSDGYLRAILLAFLIGSNNNIIAKYESHNYKKIAYSPKCA